jgi:hypothetical protein
MKPFHDTSLNKNPKKKKKQSGLSDLDLKFKHPGLESLC